MTPEEQELFNKIASLKRENELLKVVFEEVEELIKTGYDGPFLGESVRGIFYSYNEYNKWRHSEHRREKEANS